MGLSLAVAAATRADRGALTLEGAPTFTVLSMAPPLGTAGNITGTQVGGLLGLRYALSNGLELTVTGAYEAPAHYYHDGTKVVTENGTFVGTLQSRVSAFGVTAGARYVRGFVWRFFVGGELGWSRRSFGTPDLIDVTDPQRPASFGLSLRDTIVTSLVAAPLVGFEWVASDHLTISLAPRAQMFVGSSGTTFALLVPLTIGYSWYLL